MASTQVPNTGGDAVSLGIGCALIHPCRVGLDHVQGVSAAELRAGSRLDFHGGA